MVIYPGKWIFLATPHTGSTAIENAIEHGPMKDAIYRNRIHAPMMTRRSFQHFSMEDLGKNPVVNKRLKGGEQAWAVHRNPYDLAVTWWLRYMADGRVQGGPLDVPLPNFIKRFAKLPLLVGGRIHWHTPDVWIKYENLVPGINSFLRSHDCPDITLDIENITTEKKAWQTYYDECPEAVAAMNERFGDEIVEFGYSLLTA